MSGNLKFFFIAFLASFFIWGGVNALTKYFEDFFFWEIYGPPPDLFLAQVSPYMHKNLKEEPPEIDAQSAISVKIYKSGDEKVIFEKNPDKTLPIASLTKLMTAHVALEYYDPSEILRISPEAVDQPEDFGQLRVGERLSVENLLYIMLIESSNDSAYALSELIHEEGFVGLMNIEAYRLGLENTDFADSTGYSSKNRSTVKDLAKFARYLTEEKPEIWEITAHPNFKLYDPDGILHHQLLSTNEILNDFSEVVGGKTGYTTEAKGCLILILKNPKNDNIL